ncbi:hypothetical protein [Desulfococcus sp.]|uniref:hypothetical protein n=1 Tax=Desulfococcus sp. TaxID=2025834 RepID=UPI003594379C
MNTDTLQKHFNVIRIIWLAMLTSLGIYLVVSRLVGDAVRQEVGNGVALDLMRRILISISAALLIFMDVFRKRMMKPRPGMTVAAVVQRYSLMSLVSFAVAESIGIFGLVLYFLGDAEAYLYFLIGISALAMFYYRPRFGTLETLVATTTSPAPSGSAAGT